MPAKKQITRQMILSSALEILKSGGMEAVNVKSLAKSLNCSTQPIYLSFANMDTLRVELSSFAVTTFIKEMKEMCGDDEVNLYGMPYIRFAQKEAKLFQFLFMRQNAFGELKEVLSPSIDCSINKLMKQYHIGREEADNLHDQLWVHTHGIAAMIATGVCDWNMEKAAKMIHTCELSLTQKYGG